MVKEIPSELKTFKEKLSAKLAIFNSYTSTITSKLSSIIAESDSLRQGIETNYKSSIGSTSFSTNISSISSTINKINSDISTTLSSAIQSAGNIIKNIDKLEDLKSEIDSIESNIFSESSKSEPNQDTLSSLKSSLSSKSSEFDTLLETTQSELTKLKSIDKTADVKNTSDAGITTTTNATNEDSKTTTSTISDYTSELKNLKYGKFYKKRFTASNGTKIDYLVYVPDYGKEVEGLPINMYIHGSGMGENSFSRLTQSGIGRFIKDKNLKPSGIVVLPLIPNGKVYEQRNFRNALAELPYSVAKDYKADTKRISLSGHSYGAITAYRLVNENPNKFTAIVPVSGSIKNLTSSFKNVKVWAFHGTEDAKANNTSYAQAVSAVKSITQMGGEATMHAYKGKGHGGTVVIDTFTKTYEKDGKMVNPLEWAFSQKRA